MPSTLRVSTFAVAMAVAWSLVKIKGFLRCFTDLKPVPEDMSVGWMAALTRRADASCGPGFAQSDYANKMGGIADSKKTKRV